MTTIVEMRRERANLWAQMQGLYQRAADEKRALVAEEQEQWERMDGELARLRTLIDRAEELDAREAGSAVSEVPNADGDAGDGERRDKVAVTNTDEYRSAFQAYLRSGVAELPAEQRAMLAKAQQQLDGEQARALGVGAGPTGGFSVPDAAMARIVEAQETIGGVRLSRAQKRQTTTGADLPVPLNDDTANEGVRLGENVAVAELDTAFRQKILRSYMYTSRMIRVSYQFLQDTSLGDFESWLMGLLGERIGRVTNRDFTLGQGGGNEPEGLVTASVLGATTIGAGEIVHTDLIELEHSVDPAYRARGEWMFHDSTLKLIKQLDDGMGRPLFLPGLAVREPDTILQHPYVINQHMAAPGPAGFVGNEIAVLFGDMSYYWIRDVRGITVVRLNERYAENLQVAFLAFSRHDGALMDAGTHPVRHLVIQ